MSNLHSAEKPGSERRNASQILAGVAADAFLVDGAVLRRIIRRDRYLTGLSLDVPHRKCYVIARDRLMGWLQPGDLDREPDLLADPLVLIAAPEPDEVAELTEAQERQRCWRLLFHARVHQAIAAARLSPAVIRERIHRLGQVEFDEVRTVLRQEKFLLPPRDDSNVFDEFAAVYLELKYFDPALLSSYFPAVENLALIDQVLALDLNAEHIFLETRPSGALWPAPDSKNPSVAPAQTGDAIPEPVERRGVLIRWAQRAQRLGNDVRAAITFQRARDSKSARTALNQLAGRLRDAMPTKSRAPLDQALAALLPAAGRGLWPAEARLLYDLQSACVDRERPIYANDLVEWAYHRGRRPLMRLLPDQPLVLQVRHLRRAAQRLPAARVRDANRQTLLTWLHEALGELEKRLRDQLRPRLVDTLRDVGLIPDNLPERVASNKLVEELLDRVVANGFLKLGDLRDGISRNQLKMLDLASPHEWIAGDPLLQANRLLADRAVGVYRRGEVYLRVFQRPGALLFGTWTGRLITRYLAIPFGGAYATIIFAQEMLHLMRLPHHLHAERLGYCVAALGIFYLLLFHAPRFRLIVGNVVSRLGWGIRALVWEAPLALLRWRWVRWVLTSWPLVWIGRYALKPLFPAIVLGLVANMAGLSTSMAIGVGVAIFVLASIFVNTGWGRNLEEAALDWLGRRWSYLHQVVPGLIRYSLDFFKAATELIDKVLYGVDEWLRFRQGESRVGRALKTAIGFVWFLASYVVRFVINLMVEPTFNPVKHFPAVTVAAKLLIPFWPALIDLFSTPLRFLGKPLADSIAFGMIHLLPGIAGFLVWELKENWRLYRANRPALLQPVVVGSHGETVPRLLRPGFHSGTLPKLYAKLRRAQRRAVRDGDPRKVDKLQEQLHHIEVAFRQFVERELIACLQKCPDWTTLLHVTSVELGSNRIRAKLVMGNEVLELIFDEQSGWLLARGSMAAAAAQLNHGESVLWPFAVRGLYKLAGVDFVREELEAALPKSFRAYDFAANGLVVWLASGNTEVLYNPRQYPNAVPSILAGSLEGSLPSLPMDVASIQRQTLSWKQWVAFWQDHDSQGKVGVPSP